MTGLRLTRRRLLAGFGAGAAGAGGLYAVPPMRVGASLQGYDYVLDVQPAGPHDVQPVGELDQPVRRVVRSAVDGGYETSDPPPELLAFLGDATRTDHVRAQSGYYRLDPTFPVYRAWLEPVPAGEAVDPVPFDEFEACYHPDPRGFVPPPTGTPEEPAERYYVDPRLRECVDRHPYVVRNGRHYRYRLVVDDPGAPYTLDAEGVSARSLAGVPERATVVDWSELSPAVRDALRAGEQRHVARTDVPEGLVRLTATADYVRRDGEFLEPRLDAPAEWPVEVAVEVLDPVAREFDPAWLRLSVHNRGDAPVDLSSQPPAPFGVVRVENDEGASRIEDGDESIVLWSPSYGEHDHHQVIAGRVEDRNLALVHEVATLDAGESLRFRYGVRRNPGRLSPGEYVGRLAFRAAEADGDPDYGQGTLFPLDLSVVVDRPG